MVPAGRSCAGGAGVDDWMDHETAATTKSGSSTRDFFQGGTPMAA
jgi:hypothetical protein